VRVQSANGDTQGLNISSDTNGDAFIDAGYSVSDLKFGINGLERMRIDSSGQLLVGMSSSSGTADGLRVIPNDFLGFTTNVTDAGDRLVLLNRQASDGTHIEFRKANSTVGSIGSRGSGTSFITLKATSGAGAGLTGSDNRILPMDESALADNNTDLGMSSYRFKDLYLGGGVYVGGTGSANKLDDYEEGFWTPTFSRGGTALSPTPSYSTREGTYTKIGDFVHVSCEIRFNNNFSGGSGSYLISNLPFTAENQLDGISWGLMTVFNNTWTFTYTFAYISGTTVQLSSNMSLASSTTDQYLCFSAHYKVA